MGLDEFFTIVPATVTDSTGFAGMAFADAVRSATKRPAEVRQVRLTWAPWVPDLDVNAFAAQIRRQLRAG